MLGGDEQLMYDRQYTVSRLSLIAVNSLDGNDTLRQRQRGHAAIGASDPAGSPFRNLRGPRQKTGSCQRTRDCAARWSGHSGFGRVAQYPKWVGGQAEPWPLVCAKLAATPPCGPALEGSASPAGQAARVHPAVCAIVPWRGCGDSGFGELAREAHDRGDQQSRQAATLAPPGSPLRGRPPPTGNVWQTRGRDPGSLARQAARGSS